MDYDVIIIGGGVAGTTAGAVLATDAGKKVLLLEQAPILGGRTVSFRGEAIQDAQAHNDTLKKAALSYVSDRSEPPFEEMIEKHLLDGYVFEGGVRASWRNNMGRVSELMRYYNRATHFFGNEGLVAIGAKGDYTAKNFPFPNKPEWMTEEDWMETIKVTMVRNQLAKTVEETFAYDNVTLKDWLASLTENETALEWHYNRCGWHTVVSDPALNTLGEDLRANLIFSNDPKVTLASGTWGFAGSPGTQHLSISLSEIIEMNGGTVMKGATVQEVLLEDGGVKGVKTTVAGVEYTFNAPTVICTVRNHELPAILPIEKLDEPFRIAAERATKGSCLSCYIGMSQSIVDFAPQRFNKRAFMWAPIVAREEEGFRGDIPIVGVDLGEIAPSRCPAGKHLIAWAANILAEEAADPVKSNLIIDRYYEFFDSAFPGWRSAMDWIMFVINEGALIWRKPEDPHPDVISNNIKGLYFAGENYGKYVSCQGKEGAVQSALYCVEAITGLELREKILGKVLA